MTRFLFFITLLFSLPTLGQNGINFNTPGTHTFTVPAGVTVISVKAWGAGGGGSKANLRAGGGGAFAGINTISVIPGATYTVTVGAGAAKATGADGQDSSFSTLVIAKGGKGGANGGTGGSAAESTVVGAEFTWAKWNGGNGGTSNHNNNGGAGGGGAAGSLGPGEAGANGTQNDGGRGGYGGGLGGGNGGNGEGNKGDVAGSGSSPGGGGGEKNWKTFNEDGGGGNGLVVVSWYCMPTRATQFGATQSICYNKDRVAGSNNIGGLTFTGVPVGNYVAVNVIKGVKYRIETTNKNLEFIKQLTLFNSHTNELLGTINAASTTSVAVVEAVATFTGVVQVVFGTDNCLTAPGTDDLKVTYLGGSNNADDKNAAGTNSWIGHVYDFSDSAAVPPSDYDAFATYLGQFTIENSEIDVNGIITKYFQKDFNTSSGGQATCFPFTAGGIPQTFYTETFAVRYKMKTTPQKYPAGCYLLSVTGDDGVRIRIDGNLVFNEWKQESATTFQNILVYLNGNSLIEFDYYEKNGDNVSDFRIQPVNPDFNRLLTTGPITRALNVSTLLNASKITYQDGVLNPSLQIKWQSSPDKVTWTDIPGATAENYTVPGTIPTSETVMYYRRGVKSVLGTAGTNCEFFTEAMQITTTLNTMIVTGSTVCQGGSSVALKAETSCNAYMGVRTASGSGGIADDTSYDSARSKSISINFPALPAGAVVVRTITSITYTSNYPSYLSELYVEATPPAAVGNKVVDLQPSTLDASGTLSDIPIGNWGTGNPAGNWLFRFRENTYDPSTTPDATISNITITVLYSHAGTTDWYTTASGGTKIASGLSFNPVGVAGSGITNTNTPGTTSFYVACSSNPDSRTKVDYTILPNTPVSVSIAKSTGGAVCSGGSTTFIATPTNGGTEPSYQWKLNGINVGTNSAIYFSDALNMNDRISVVLTSNASTCMTGNPATSNVLTVAPSPGTPGTGGSYGSTCDGFVAQWGWADNVTGFYLDVATDSNFTAIVPKYANFYINNLDPRSITFSGLNPGTTYYYRVRGANSCGVSAHSPTMSYSTAGRSLAVPIANTPTGISCNQATLNWSAVPDARGYYYDIAKDAGFTNFVSGYNNAFIGYANPYLGGLPAGTFYYRVRAASDCGIVTTNSNTVSFVVGSIAGSIAGTTTVCSTTNSTNLILSGHTGNVLKWQYSAVSDFSVFTDIANTNTTLTVTNLATTRYYRAVIDNSWCTDVYSNTAKITVSSPATIPPTATPHLANCVGFTARWGAVANATSYYLDVATDASFSTLVSGYSDRDVGNTTSLALIGLNPGTTYHYRVRASNACGLSASSATMNATTETLVVNNPTGAAYTFCISESVVTTTNTADLSWGEVVAVQVVKGFVYTFSVGNVFAGENEHLMLLRENKTFITGNTSASGASFSWTATYSGKVLLRLSTTSCGGTTVSGSGAITLQLNAVGNTQDNAALAGNNAWRGHLYKWSGAAPPGGSSPDSLTESYPFVTENYVGYTTENETFSQGFGGDTACFPVYSDGTARTEIITENFAVRYRMNSTKPAGCYIASPLTSDDGSRLYVDGNLVWNDWSNHSAFINSRLIYLNGNSNLVYDYYENWGGNSIGFGLISLENVNTISATNTTVCTGNPIVLNGSSYDSYYLPENPIRFQWQSSSNNMNWNDIPGATNEDYTATVNTATTTYYRRVVSTNLRGGCSYPSPAVAIVTTALPAQPTLGTVIQISCANATGSVTLNNLPTGHWEINQSGRAIQRYSGSGNSYAITGLAAGTYTFSVTNAGDCTSASTAEITITSNDYTTWNGTIWSHGTPDATKNVIINGALTISADMAACGVTINSGFLVTVESGVTLTVTNAVTTNGQLIFENTASLLQTTNVENRGNIEYHRTSSQMKDMDYTYWASPVAHQNIVELSPNTHHDKYHKWNGTVGWEEYYDDMIPGAGYIIRTPKEGLWPNKEDVAFPYSQKVTFKGVPNNGNYKFDVGPDEYNLVGNPYPSALDADQFITQNAGLIYGALYFWTHNTAIKQQEQGSHYDYTADDYATYTLTGGVGTGVGKAATNPGLNNSIPLGKIAAGQSFFVGNQPKSGTFVFNNSMRVAGNNAQFFGLKNTQKTTIEKNRIWLNLTNSRGAFKQLLVGYLSGATNGWDNLYDGPTFDGQEFVDFYSVNQGQNLTIQGRALPFENTDEVPLGYRSTIEGQFEIAIDSRDGKLATHEIWLEDKKTGVTHDLVKSSYAFSAIEGVENDRFVLKYFNKSLGTDDNEMANKAVLVAVKNKTISVISTADALRKIEIFDVLGRLLYTKSNLNSQEWIIPNFTSSEQTLVVKTTLENGAISSKKIVF